MDNSRPHSDSDFQGDLDRLFAVLIQLLQDSVRNEVAACQNEVRALLTSEGEGTRRSVGDIGRNNTLAVANGKTICNLDSLNVEDYDIILNAIEFKLRARSNPAKHSPLKEYPLDGIGSDLMKMFRFMLEHPGYPIALETLEDIDKDLQTDSQETLRKRISYIRKVIPRGDVKEPYVVTRKAWGESISRRGTIYMANPRWRYLVIRHPTRIT